MNKRLTQPILLLFSNHFLNKNYRHNFEVKNLVVRKIWVQSSLRHSLVACVNETATYRFGTRLRYIVKRTGIREEKVRGCKDSLAGAPNMLFFWFQFSYSYLFAYIRDKREMLRRLFAPSSNQRGNSFQIELEEATYTLSLFFVFPNMFDFYTFRIFAQFPALYLVQITNYTI